MVDKGLKQEDKQPHPYIFFCNSRMAIRVSKIVRLLGSQALPVLSKDLGSHQSELPKWADACGLVLLMQPCHAPLNSYSRMIT